MNNNILSFKENISKIKDLKSFYIKKISLKNFILLTLNDVLFH